MSVPKAPCQVFSSNPLRGLVSPMDLAIPQHGTQSPGLIAIVVCIESIFMPVAEQTSPRRPLPEGRRPRHRSLGGFFWVKRSGFSFRTPHTAALLKSTSDLTALFQPLNGLLLAAAQSSRPREALQNLGRDRLSDHRNCVQAPARPLRPPQAAMLCRCTFCLQRPCPFRQPFNGC